MFERRLDSWERIDASVIKVYKCSEACKCEECKMYVDCEILRKVKDTARKHEEFARWAEDNGGWMLY